jgi:hypothetical protein
MICGVPYFEKNVSYNNDNKNIIPSYIKPKYLNYMHIDICVNGTLE